MRTGWYIARLPNSPWEAVKVTTQVYDGNGVKAGEHVAESAGYSTAFHVEKFEFHSRLKMPRNRSR